MVKICSQESEIPAIDIPLVNGNCSNKVLGNGISKDNGQYNNTSVNDVLTNNRNHDNKVVLEEPSKNEGKNNNINGSSTPSGDGSACFHQDNSDETGFIKVVNKKKRKKIRNQPPGRKAESIRHDNGIDKKNTPKNTSVNLSEKPPNRNGFSSATNSGMSYKCALLNGNFNKSESTNGLDSKKQVNADATKKNQLTKFSNNCDLSQKCIHSGQLSITKAKSTATDGTLAVSCRQNNSCTKVTMSDLAVQTDCSQKEKSLREVECLPSHEDAIEESVLVDYVDDGDKIIDDSSNLAYCDSVASNDSGRGESIVTSDKVIFRCLFPTGKVALLMGRHGRYKEEVQGRSGVKIRVCNLDKDAPFVIVEIKGLIAQIEKAKEIIQERFQFPLKQIFDFVEWEPLSAHYAATLPEGTYFPGMASCIIDPSFFWIQQYDHPLSYQLAGLEERMSDQYNTDLDAPRIVDPEIGNIVGVPAREGSDEGRWSRGWVMDVIPEEGNVIIRYLDHGGDFLKPIDSLRPMRHEFFSMPFFAAQCSLYGILPAGNTWSPEAIAEFVRLCYGSHPPTIRVADKSPTCYFITMHAFDHERNTIVDFATVLVEKGFAIDYRVFPPADHQ